MAESTSDLGITIRRARERKRMTQEELAEKLGVTRSTVARWEGGDHFPLRNAGAIEEVLEIIIPAPAAAPS